tara:strand:+ start:291 stop:929 length:639 start_codon:yes stop_codon:yes gene_type:complete
MSSEKKTILVWTDLETTGLDRNNGRILEYGIVFTDLNLNEITSMEGLVKQDVDELRPLMDDYVTKMHTDNGLLDELRKAGPGVGVGYENQRVICDVAITTVIKSLQAQHPTASFVLAGSTVGFDRGFIEVHMPSFFKQLHYRQLDVSGYKVGFPEIFGSSTSDAHRAMADIRESIEVQRKARRFMTAGHGSLTGRATTVPQTRPTFDEDDCC